MLPVKHLAPKTNLMTEGYCGCQIAQRLGWVAPAYLKKVQPPIWRGQRPDWWPTVRVWTWNIGSLSETGEDCEELKKRMIDVHCLEVRWRGQGARMLGWMEKT